MSLDAFWQRSDKTINQMLHRLLGNHQMDILDKQIVGVTKRKHKNPERRERNV